MKLIVSILLVVLYANYATADIVIDGDITFNVTLPITNLSDTGSSLLNIANGLVNCLITEQNTTLSELGNALTALNTSLTNKAFNLVTVLIEAVLIRIGAVIHTLNELFGTAPSIAVEVETNLLALSLQIQTLKVQIQTSVLTGLHDILEDANVANSSLVLSIKQRISQLTQSLEISLQDAINTGFQFWQMIIDLDPQVINFVGQTLNLLVNQFSYLFAQSLSSSLDALVNGVNLTLFQKQDTVDQLASTVRPVVHFIGQIIDTFENAVGDAVIMKNSFLFGFGSFLSFNRNQILLVIPGLETQLSNAFGSVATAYHSLITTLKGLSKSIATALNSINAATGGKLDIYLCGANERFFECGWCVRTCVNPEPFCAAECDQPSECGCDSGFVRSAANGNACVNETSSACVAQRAG